MRLNVVFLEGLQAQNVLIMFLFSMKHSYLLTAKTTQDVNFYMVWKGYCKQLPAYQKQLLVSDYGLN